MKNKLLLPTVIGAMLMLSACQQSEDLPTSVNQRWAAITAQDYETAYGYFSPGYKETESLDGYRLRMATAQLNVKWKNGTYEGEECSDEQVCEVKVNILYEYSFPKRSMGGMEVNTSMSENWIKLDGKWYFVPKNK
jgi:hypothetical protein